MSVRHTYYFVYGVEYEADDFPDPDNLFEEFEEYVDSTFDNFKKSNDIRAIFDMDGEKVVIGYVIAKSFEYATELKPNYIVHADLSNEKKGEIESKLRNEFGLDKEPNYMLVLNVT